LSKETSKKNALCSSAPNEAKKGNCTGVIFDIKRYAIHDGPGIRTTVFFKGCPLVCKWCHNPESWSAKPEPGLRLTRCIRCGRCKEVCPNNAVTFADDRLVIDTAKCTVCGDCVKTCPSGAREIIGKEVTVEQVVEEIRKDIVFYEQSGGGATFSGGEPLMQPDFLYELTRCCKSSQIHTAVDTTCHADAEVIKRISENTDLFLCDIKHMDSVTHQRFTGVPNELILANLKWLASAGKKIIIRLAVIPGFNDEPSNIEKTAEFAASLKNIARIDLLPYNIGGREKADRLTVDYPIMKTDQPSDEQIASIARTIEGFGFEVKIGG
jgi:pyruvate formate lyase activating enzyme